MKRAAEKANDPDVQVALLAVPEFIKECPPPNVLRLIARIEDLEYCFREIEMLSSKRAEPVIGAINDVATRALTETPSPEGGE